MRPNARQLVRMNTPERLSDGIGAQVDDLNQVVSGTGEQLSSVVVQVQRRYSAQQLQLPHYTLRSDTTNKTIQHTEAASAELSSISLKPKQVLRFLAFGSFFWDLEVWTFKVMNYSLNSQHPATVSSGNKTHSPDVPESNFLVEVSAHHTLLRTDDVVTAGTSKHSLHTCSGDTATTGGGVNPWDDSVLCIQYKLVVEMSCSI